MIPDEGPFGDAFRTALRKRRKAIKQKLRQLETERLVDRSDEGDLSGLSVECDLWMPRTRIRICVWDNRWVWFDARQGSKQGWRWFYTHEGRMFGEETGPRLVAALESSVGSAHDAAHDGRMTFAAIWEPLLAQGPKEARFV